MRITMFEILEAAILASSLSIDSFTAGFAYGSKKIRIPMLSVQIINIICASVTGLSLYAGAFLKPWLPAWLTVILAFTILFITGLLKLLDCITKSVIKKHTNLNKELKLSLLNFKFILNVYADPAAADADESKTISATEAAAIAFSLSLDAIAVGFGAALTNVNGIAVFVWSLLTNVTAIMLGCGIGNKIADKLPFNISWLSGIILIGLAFSKLI